MPDGPNGPARRGRRDPELAAQLVPTAQEDNLLSDEQEGVDEVPIFLLEGDIVTAKITHTVEIIPGKDSWFTYGVQTRVAHGEAENDTFLRAANIVHGRLGEMISDSVEAYEEERKARSTRPINYNG